MAWLATEYDRPNALDLGRSAARVRRRKAGWLVRGDIQRDNGR
jgi:hypothetical protein